MIENKKENKEKELDSFLKSAQEFKEKSVHNNWDSVPPVRQRRGNMLGVAFLAGIVVIAIVAIYLFKEMKGLKGFSMEKNIEQKDTGLTPQGNSILKIDQGKYQAIFLTNGQVYFGKLASYNESYIELVDIFYLQVKPVLQQGDESNNNKNSQEQKTELSLVKLGNELHGPLDRMMINKDQVVFVEDLKDDSKVTDAIKRYQQGQNQK